MPKVLLYVFLMLNAMFCEKALYELKVMNRLLNSGLDPLHPSFPSTEAVESSSDPTSPTTPTDSSSESFSQEKR